jgi:hypothetical protein
MVPDQSPLCKACEGIRVHELVSECGQEHSRSIYELSQSAKSCKLCALLYSNNIAVEFESNERIRLFGVSDGQAEASSRPPGSSGLKFLYLGKEEARKRPPYLRELSVYTDYGSIPYQPLYTNITDAYEKEVSLKDHMKLLANLFSAERNNIIVG